MSCWVVPAIAAELWGVTLAQVLAGVADGTVRWQREHGFLFVDASARCHSHQTTRKPEGPPPPTFVPVTREAGDDGFDAIVEQELLPSQDPTGAAELLTAEVTDSPTPDLDPDWPLTWSDGDSSPLEDAEVCDILPPDPVPADPVLSDPVLEDPGLASSVTVEEDPELPPLCEEEDNEPIGHWRQRRQSVARTRRPPPLAA
jgi:hypothetical protein